MLSTAGCRPTCLQTSLIDDCTAQVLVYFAVAKKGEAPTDGKTDLNPEGLTAAYGPHAESIAHLLHANGLSCGLPAKPDFVKAMLEKLVWIWWVAGLIFMAFCRTRYSCILYRTSRCSAAEVAKD